MVLTSLSESMPLMCLIAGDLWLRAVRTLTDGSARDLRQKRVALQDELNYPPLEISPSMVPLQLAVLGV